jgi:hypothetical protein
MYCGQVGGDTGSTCCLSGVRTCACPHMRLCSHCSAQQAAVVLRRLNKVPPLAAPHSLLGMLAHDQGMRLLLCLLLCACSSTVGVEPRASYWYEAHDSMSRRHSGAMVLVQQAPCKRIVVKWWCSC